jgi:hypothetical protein
VMEKTPIGRRGTSDQPWQDHEDIATINGEKVNVATTEHLENGTWIIAPTTTFTLEEEKRIIRLLDWHIMPLIFLLYSLSVWTVRISGMPASLEWKRISISVASSIIGLLRYSILPVNSIVLCSTRKSNPNFLPHLVKPSSNPLQLLILSQTSFLNGPNLSGKPSNPSLGCLYRLWLGHHLIPSIHSDQLGRIDGLSLRPRNCRGDVRPAYLYICITSTRARSSV